MGTVRIRAMYWRHIGLCWTSHCGSSASAPRRSTRRCSASLSPLLRQSSASAASARSNACTGLRQHTAQVQAQQCACLSGGSRLQRSMPGGMLLPEALSAASSARWPPQVGRMQRQGHTHLFMCSKSVDSRSHHSPRREGQHCPPAGWRQQQQGATRIRTLLAACMPCRAACLCLLETGVWQ